MNFPAGNGSGSPPVAIAPIATVGDEARPDIQVNTQY
jgi:hypothetical protein